jgi:DNA-binding beta-propeller fold protein YncE
MKRLCLLSAGENKLTFYDTDLKKEKEFSVKGIKNAGPRKMAYAGGFLFSANSYDGSISRIDIHTGKEITREVCVYPTGIAYIPHSGRLAVTCGETDRLIIIDQNLQAVDSTGCKSFPLNVALSADGNRLLSACLSLRKIKMFDSRSYILKSEIELNGYPYYALEDAAGNIYATYSNEGYFAEGKICVYNTAKQKGVEGDTGKMPTTICIAEEEGRVFVANTGNKSVDIFDKQSLKKVGAIETDYMPDDVLYDSGAVFVTCMLDSSLIKADTNGKIIKKLITRKEPRGLLLIDV